MSDRVNLFMALETVREEEEVLQCFTGKVMRWDTNLWLLDLGTFYSYWLERAIQHKSSVTTLWREVLNQTFGSQEMDVQEDYRAALAGDPWRALLLLNGMKENRKFGFVDGRSKMGRRLLSQVSWNAWWQGLSGLTEVWGKQKLPRFKASKLRKQGERFKLAMDRLGIKKPLESKILTLSGIKTRYGRCLSWVWAWTFDQTVEARFPWRNHLFQQPPKVKRFLEDASFYWEPLSVLLQEDLDQLCDALGYQLVTRIHWTITLEDMTEMIIPIQFRNPHDLKSEKGEHLTVLLQAQAAIEAFFKQHLEEEEIPSLILNWTLELMEMMTLPSIQYDIFGEAFEEESGELTLARLENQLSVPLQRFVMTEDWVPETSFKAWEGEGANQDLSLKEAAFTRPLYLWAKPKPIPQLAVEGLEFLESSMNAWWLPEQENAHRQYFREGNRWVFYDGKGSWFEHGIFA